MGHAHGTLNVIGKCVLYPIAKALSSIIYTMAGTSKNVSGSTVILIQMIQFCEIFNKHASIRSLETIPKHVLFQKAVRYISVSSAYAANDRDQLEKNPRKETEWRQEVVTHK